MSSMSSAGLPLGIAPDIVSKYSFLLTAWNAIDAWFQIVLDNKDEKKTFQSSACFILMTCKFMAQRLQKMSKDGEVEGEPAAQVIQKVRDVSRALGKSQVVTSWLGQDSSFKASVSVGTALFNTLFQQRNQYGSTQPLSRGVLLPVYRVWEMISLVIEISPEPQVVKSKDVKDKLAWLQKQMESLKRPQSLDAEDSEKSKKVKTAPSEVMKHIEVIDPLDLEIVKRYDNQIGIVPIEGPVKNRSVVTAHDVSTLSQGQWVNDTAIDAYLTLVCHTTNGLFQKDAVLPKSPKYHVWSTSMSLYLEGRKEAFQARHLRQEWPPARFPDAVLEDVTCHIFPLHVKGNHWILLVLQKQEDGQWTLFFYSSMSGYQEESEEPWRFISSWFLYKSKGAFDVRKPRVEVPNPQPTQTNFSDCGVFLCGIVRWSLVGWDLASLTPRVIPEFRRRMILELEKWSLSTNRL